MLKHILNYWQNNALILALIVTVGISVGSLINPSYITNAGIRLSDKILHTGSYIILMLAWLMFINATTIKISQWHVLFILIIFGIILELIQVNLTQSRTGEFGDVLANTLGLIMGLLLFNFWLKKLIH